MNEFLLPNGKFVRGQISLNKDDVPVLIYFDDETKRWNFTGLNQLCSPSVYPVKEKRKE